MATFYKLIILTIIITITASFQKEKSLKGIWEYRGGKFNNKISPAPKNYQQQRKYTDTQFDAFLLEQGEKPVKYESGNYTLKTDSCLETQTYCLQAQNMLGITVHYRYIVRNDTLILKGILPNGSAIEDYWKKVK
jgi:hypothetical protein